MRSWILFFSFYFFIASVQAASLQQEINQVLAKSQGKAKIGIVVQSLNSGEILYQRNANQPLVPASTMKVLTAYAALRQLGPNYTYRTQVLTDATQPVTQGALQGNLYVKFDGDPSLKTEDLQRVFAKLKAKGIRTVTGNLIIDDKHYDNKGVSLGTVATDTQYCYGAPVGTVNLNRNCVLVTVIPGKKAGQRAQIRFPNNVPLPITNRVVTQAPSKKACGLGLSQPKDSPLPILGGCVKLRSKPRALLIALKDPRQYGRTAVVSLLQQQRIRVKGKTLIQATASSNLKILVTHNSKPMRALVFSMLRKSDNLIANALFKKVGAIYFKKPGSWDYGSKAIRTILAANQKVNTSQMELYDGSGLSRFNQITATQLLQVLNQAWQEPKVADAFIAGLSISGDPAGGLRRRMGDPGIRGKVKAKTGTMKGIISLAGYVETRSQQVLAFSIIVNAPGGSIAHYRALEDKICRILSRV